MMKKNVLVSFPIELLKKVEQYQQENMLTTRNAAILELIRNGLKQSNDQKK